jgi:diguanylate cyclase (GGDEF)-like protein
MASSGGVQHHSRLMRRAVAFAALGACYIVAAKLGLKLSFVHPSATAVWPPTGITLAAYLILDYDVWPVIFGSAFIVNLTTAGSVATSIGIAAGNTLEGLVGAYLVNRFANGRHACDRAGDVFKLAVLAAMVSTTVSATIGVTTLSLGGFAPWGNYGSIWGTWWLGDAVGAMLVAPPILLWTVEPRMALSGRQRAEAAVLFGSLMLVAVVVFGVATPWHTRSYPLEFLCTPLLLWAAFRFRRREAATALLIVGGIAIWGTLMGFGPFVRGSVNESLLLLQAFTGVTAVMTLMLAAVVVERRDAVERLRQLAVSDPLTGLANYRQLVTVLGAEIRRSDRTGRPFAVLLLDLDGLKRINDRHGHLVGSQALCRLAAVLRVSSRAIDTAARFGGDEFVLILPETDRTRAQQVSERIVQRLATDGEKPTVSVSVGVACYPENGAQLEPLLSAADAALYAVKLTTRGKSVRRP